MRKHVDAGNASCRPFIRTCGWRAFLPAHTRAMVRSSQYHFGRMDTMRRFFARHMLELQLRRAKGYAFEELFKAVMQRRYADFTPIQPYGNLGDRKNDGYIRTSGTFFQLYAPKDPDEKLGAAAKKAEGDFLGLKDYWHSKCPIKCYRFTFNDQYGGSVVPVEGALLAIAKAHSIDARPFLCKDLESEALQLSMDQLQDVLGTLIPESGLLRDADYYAVRDVVEHVLNTAAPIVPEGKLVAPEFDAKIKFNGLSDTIGRLLGAAALQTDVVDDFFSNRSGNHRQDLRDHLAVFYAKERARVGDGKSSADLVFVGILEAITPNSSKMKKAVQDAALVVMAYYFEACDIFEGSDASA